MVDRDAPTTAHRGCSEAPSAGVDKVTLERIEPMGILWSVRLVDMLDSETIEREILPGSSTAEEYIVLDTETTGVDPQTDDVIEIAGRAMRAAGSD